MSGRYGDAGAVVEGARIRTDAVAHPQIRHHRHGRSTPF
jgi:hypothetical protein